MEVDSFGAFSRGASGKIAHSITPFGGKGAIYA
nr:MAG TPA: hypothetical protein [Caudoviricetes sp.]